MRALAAALMALALAAPAAAEVRDYDACLDLARNDPVAAREQAASWARLGGGAPARLCEAQALAALGALGSAARTLADLAADPSSGLGAADRARILGLAGQFWLDDGAPDLADAALDRALALDPGAPALLEARARARAALEDWRGARADLDAALNAEPGAPERLALRAAARRRLGDMKGALADATEATAAGPDLASAWFEKGAAEAALGRRDAARESLLTAIRLAPNGPLAGAARIALQDLDAG